MASKKNEIIRNEKYMSDVINCRMLNFVRAAMEKNNYIWAENNYKLESVLIGTNMDTQPINKMIDSKQDVKFNKSEVSKQDIDMLENTEHSIVNKHVTQGKKWSVPDILADENSEIIENKSAIVKENLVKSSDYRHENIDNTLIHTDMRYGNDSVVNSDVKINSFQKMHGQEGYRIIKMERKKMADLKTTKLNDFQNIDKYQNKIGDSDEKFQNWCLKRKSIHKNSLQKLKSDASTMKYFEISKLSAAKCDKDIINHSSHFQEQRKEFSNVSENFCNHSGNNEEKKIIDQADLIIPNKSVADKHMKKRNRHHSTDEKRHKVFVSHHINETSISDQTMLSISITSEKSHKLVTEYQDLKLLKKNFPKFSEVIPDVDSSAIEFNYSADAMKILLGYLLNPSYNFDAIRNEITAMEVLSLMYSWEIVKFQDIFHKHVVKNILNESNACRIYSLAEHFRLNEIADACKKLVKNIKHVKFKQKKCSITISIYMEPIEFCISLYPIAGNLNESFNKPILNEILIEAISGHYSITGIQIQLNVESQKNNLSELQIYYSAENTTDNIEIPEQSVKKHLNSKIFLYFSKNLVLKPKDKGKISIYTEIKPCLCYTFKEAFYKEKGPNEKFSLTLKSNYRVKNEKVFFVHKILYHSKSSVV